MREAQASRRPAARPMLPMLPAALPADGGDTGAGGVTRLPALPALPAEGGDTGAGGATRLPVLPAEGGGTARAASPPVCGPVRPEMLMSADEAAMEQTAALRTRWSQVYGREASSYNVAYLRKACTAPGMNVRRKRAPTGSGGAPPSPAGVLARQAAAVAMASDDEDEANEEDEDEADELSDCGLSEEYSVYDSESEGEVGRLPLAEDRYVVRRQAQSVSSGDEHEGVSGKLCSEDERELEATRQRLLRKRKAATSNS